MLHLILLRCTTDCCDHCNVKPQRRGQMPAPGSRHIDPFCTRVTMLSTSFDASVDLRDVQIAARHADPRTTMRYDRARQNLDRHPNYILVAYMASGT
jgi:integrase/recombinase XerD